MSKKRNFFLAGIVAAGLAAVGIKTASKRKQADNDADEALPHEENRSDTGADKTTDEDTSDSADTPAASGSYTDHRNIPRPGAL